MPIFKIFNMKKHVLIVLVVAMLTLTSAVYALDFDGSQISGLNVTTDIEGAFSESQAQNKTLAIIFDQDICVYCDMFKDDVLSNRDVQKELNEHYIVLLVDINKNPDIATKYKVYGTPTTQFLDSNGKEIYKIEGYVTGDEFLKDLREI